MTLSAQILAPVVPTQSSDANSVSRASTFEQRRRLVPRLWDTDWLVLRDMHRAIDAMAARVAKPGQTAVDFGCGEKPYESLFTSRGVKYLGADFDGTRDHLIQRDGIVIAPDKCADLVVSFQVLEHVRDIDTYFTEARRMLRKDGLLVLSTHGTWLYHPHPEDHRRWTREGLTNDISTRGFEVMDCIPLVGPLAWTTLVRLTCACYVLRKMPVVGAPLAGALAVVMNVRAWLEDRITPAAVTRENACVYVTLSRPKVAE
jgi:SAM-dependent methyltransferase